MKDRIRSGQLTASRENQIGLERFPALGAFDEKSGSLAVLHQNNLERFRIELLHNPGLIVGDMEGIFFIGAADVNILHDVSFTL